MEKTLKLERLPIQTQTKRGNETDDEEEEVEYYSNKKTRNQQVWDCGSTLYDSFELNSFKRQLESAIVSSSRTLSMPHLTDDRRAPPPPPVPPSVDAVAKKTSPSNRISRALHKLLQSVFKSNHNNNSKAQQQSSSSSRWLKLRDRTSTTPNAETETGAVLPTVPEVPDFGGALSPDNPSCLFRRAASARSFTPPTPTFSISCA